MGIIMKPYELDDLYSFTRDSSKVAATYSCTKLVGLQIMLDTFREIEFRHKWNLAYFDYKLKKIVGKSCLGQL